MKKDNKIKTKKCPKKVYNTHVQACVEAIKEFNILFLPDVIAYLEISRADFYDFGIDKAPEVLDAIEIQRSLAKLSLTNKWLKSDSPTLNIALYKLISTPEERLAISGKADSQDDAADTRQAYLESLEQMSADDGGADESD